MSRGPFQTRGRRDSPPKNGMFSAANGRDVRYDDDDPPDSTTSERRTTRRARPMARDHLLAIDQGTTSTRAVVYDRQLRPVGQGQAEVPPTYPQSGWVEHDPAALVASVGPSGGPGPRRSGDRGRPDRGHRPDQPARDDDPLGPPDRPGDRAGAGLAGPPDRRVLRAASRPPRPGSPSGPAWCSTRTSRPPRSPGCSTTSPTPAAAPRPASWPPGRSTACSSGT